MTVREIMMAFFGSAGATAACLYTGGGIGGELFTFTLAALITAWSVTYHDMQWR